MINQATIEELKSINILAVSEVLGLPEKLNLGDDNSGNCITGHASKSQKCFSIKPDGSMFKCFHCGCGGDVIKLVELSQGISFTESCLWLSEKFSPHLREEIQASITEPDPVRRKALLKTQIYLEIFREAQAILHSPAGEPGLRYLVDVRHYDPEILLKSDFGYIANDSAIKDTLFERYSTFPDAAERLEILVGLHIMSSDEPPSIVVPVANQYGKITGLMKRHIPVDGSEAKDSRWKCTTDLDKSAPLYLYRCKGKDTVTIVEGTFDAVYMQALGIDTIALGQAVLTDKHTSGLKEKAVTRVIIALDNDRPGADGKCTGLENTEAAINTCIKAGLEPFVIDPRNLNKDVTSDQHIKDPDEYYRTYGAEGLKTFLNTSAEPGVPWLVRRLSEKHPVADPVQRSSFIGACRDLYAAIPGNLPRFKAEVLEGVATLASITKDHVHVEFEAQKTAKVKEDAEAALIKALRNGMQHKDSGRVLRDLEVITRMQTASIPFIVPEFSFDDVFSKALSGNVEGLKTSLECFDGPDDAPKCRLKIGGLTIISGESGVGKTTLLLNLFINMLRLYIDKVFVFITYEETTGELLLKLLNVEAGVDLGRGSNQYAIRKHLGTTDRGLWNPGLQRAHDTLRGYAQDGRLRLINENYEIKNLTRAITTLCETNDVGAIFIDYIQKIPSVGEFGSQQLRLQKLSDMLRVTTQNLGCAVIIGSQVNKEGQIREAMDIFQDANLVIQIAWATQYDLYNAGIGDKPDKKTDVIIDKRYRTLNIDKGRDVESGGRMLLAFDGSVLKLSSVDINQLENQNL